MSEEDNIPLISMPSVMDYTLLPEPKRSVWWKLKRRLGIRQIKIKEGICPMCGTQMEDWLGQPVKEYFKPVDEIIEYSVCTKCGFKMEKV